MRFNLADWSTPDFSFLRDTRHTELKRTVERLIQQGQRALESDGELSSAIFMFQENLEYQVLPYPDQSKLFLRALNQKLREAVEQVHPRAFVTITVTPWEPRPVAATTGGLFRALQQEPLNKQAGFSQCLQIGFYTETANWTWEIPFAEIGGSYFWRERIERQGPASEYIQPWKE